MNPENLDLMVHRRHALMWCNFIDPDLDLWYSFYVQLENRSFSPKDCHRW